MKSVIFCNTRRTVEYVAREMSEHDFTVSSIHSDMSHEDRKMIMKVKSSKNFDNYFLEKHSYHQTSTKSVVKTFVVLIVVKVSVCLLIRSETIFFFNLADRFLMTSISSPLSRDEKMCVVINSF